MREDNVRSEFSAVGKAAGAWIGVRVFCLYVYAERSGNVRDSFERARWVGVGMAVIFLVRAQALNFQIAPANKCRVDKRGKTMPTWGLGKRVGKREKGGTYGYWKKRKEVHAVKTGAIMARKWCWHT